MFLGVLLLKKYYKQILIFVAILTLTGCFKFMSVCVDPFGVSCKTKVSFLPDELPNAVIGKPYSAMISISGGPMPDESNLDYEITPENSGLKIKPVKEGWYNDIELYGIPNIQGEIKVNLVGGVYGYPSAHFNKIFIVKVSSE